MRERSTLAHAHAQHDGVERHNERVMEDRTSVVNRNRYGLH
jgi:hypothetical protein